MMVNALMDAYDAWAGLDRAGQEGVASYVALDDPNGAALSRFFERLSAAGRASVVQLGAKEPDIAGKIGPLLKRRFGDALVDYSSGGAKTPADLVVVLADGAAENDPIDGAAYRASLSSQLGATPGAPCLVIGPPSRMRPENGSGEWSEYPAVAQATQVARAAAQEGRCAFWSAQAAMGGEGGIDGWFNLQPRLAKEDRKTLTDEGRQELAQLLASDLFTAYETWLAKSARAEKAPQ
jgi:hypothetical protein